MAFHHVALATRDLDATHRFYTEVMGFTLAKAVVAPTPNGGWARHVFYDTGGGMIAFWDLHDPKMVDFDPAISTGLGLEPWVNHIAFAASDLDDIEVRKQRWLDTGYDVVEIDHGFCVSVYANDPNGILVEFCTDTQPYTEADRAAAERVITTVEPALETPPDPKFFKAAVATPA
ncbi:MAG TPA: VOC family protein [Acidimicrobiales bacterium]|jgi:catechol 2,3-dioxygenase-like lactoylglutathione lyase family enzyme